MVIPALLDALRVIHNINRVPLDVPIMYSHVMGTHVNIRTYGHTYH